MSAGKIEDFCEKEDCKIMKTRTTLVIFGPFPKLVVINISWSYFDVTSKELLLILLNIPNCFTILEAFNITKQEKIKNEF